MRIAVFILFILIVSNFSCIQHTTDGTNIIRIQGSDTMHMLATRWAEAYMQENPDISIYVEGGGTAKGFQALINDQIDLCTASRAMLPFEVQLLAEKHRRLGLAHRVAKDALSIYLNPGNSVKNLTLDQLKSIYTGQIRTWTEVGGSENEITVITRSPNSGTYLYFKDHVLQDEPYLEDVEIYYTTNAIVNAVLENPYAIGYGGTAFGNKVTHCRINNIEPTIENVLNDSYPIARYLYIYTLDTPKGAAKEFIDWIMSSNGQIIIAQVGFIPLFQTPNP
jgi:phosphate transport system substrate-binding protein